MTSGIFLVTGMRSPCEFRVENAGTCGHLLGCRQQRELRTGTGLAVTHLRACTEPRPAPGSLCPCSQEAWALLLPWPAIALLQSSHAPWVTALLGRKYPSLLQRKEKGLSDC